MAGRGRSSSAAVILVVDGDPAVGTALRRDVARRYGHAYPVDHTSDANSGLERCRAFARRGHPVSLVLAAERLPDRHGTAFLREAHALQPDAGRVLLTGHADTETAVLAVNDPGLDRCLRTPWTDPDTELYPALDDLLAGWVWRAGVRTTLVREVMRTEQTDVAVLDATTTVAQAAARVAASRGGDLMIVDAQGALVGALSESAVLRSALPRTEAILDQGGTLHDGYQLFLRNARKLARRPITHLIVSEPFAVQPDDHVAKAAALLTDQHLRVLPVVEHGRLVGTLSQADVCRAVLEPA